MRPDTGRRLRSELAGLAAGLLAGQLLLGLCVDRAWLGVRDPEYTALRDRVAARQAEAPGRPLVLALGSSRTQMGLRAGQLNRSDNSGAPVVLNCGVPTSGPMLQQVVLKRLLDEGVRPDLVFLEVMPISLGRRHGTALEERMLDPARLDGPEAVRLCHYYHQPYRLAGRWAVARALPAYRHQAELRDVLGLDGAPDALGGEATHGLDAYGWRSRYRPVRPDEVADNVRRALIQYKDAFEDLEPAAGPLGALRDGLALCRRERIAAALVFPPESSVFRDLCAARCPRLGAEVADLAREFDVALYDARAWVPDDGFWDGHHLAVNGAEQYTERFGRDVLAPELRRLTDRRGSVAAR